VKAGESIRGGCLGWHLMRDLEVPTVVMAFARSDHYYVHCIAFYLSCTMRTAQMIGSQNTHLMHARGHIGFSRRGQISRNGVYH